MSEKSTTSANADSQPDPNAWTMEPKTKTLPEPIAAGPPVWRSQPNPNWVPPSAPPSPTLLEVLEKCPPCWSKVWTDAIDRYMNEAEENMRRHESLRDQFSNRSRGGSDDAYNMECYRADYYWTQFDNLRVRKQYMDWLKAKPFW
jgi:hypothetical protein